ncbi:DUF3179 domain-containing protein [Aureliella helgolandensis]|uniref:DUF3179 domain-containing protein n=1 Tax=Aureliella helgolandensis TaxID=2527968 RepID=A0A518G457_9BACT|nr:DUF3179 domain-containing protein [Aureliella helgolandensis]QDV23377.1 hypothetical protein Q31a_16750 [Aureliella helgolandensis]
MEIKRSTGREKSLPALVILASLVCLAFLLIGSTTEREKGNVGHALSTSQLHRIQNRQALTFDLSRATIPLNEIHSGGPPKDGIPAISNPATMPREHADFLKANERVIGVAIEGRARAYPISILNQHEIVNDRLGDIPIAVTYCPLCDSAVVFDRRTPLGEREFGVSGLLYNSNVLMYDRADSESLWSQMKSEGVSGPGAAQKLTVLPMELTSWEAWQARQPHTDVLSPETGYNRNYKANPYAGYFRQPNLMFPARPQSNALPLKERVLGIWDATKAFAIPVSVFGRQSTQLEKEINGKRIVIAFDKSDQTLRIVSADDGLQWVNAFWFAWYAFRPQTEVVTRQSIP